VAPLAGTVPNESYDLIPPNDTHTIHVSGHDDRYDSDERWMRDGTKGAERRKETMGRQQMAHEDAIPIDAIPKSGLVAVQ